MKTSVQSEALNGNKNSKQKVKVTKNPCFKGPVSLMITLDTELDPYLRKVGSGSNLTFRSDIYQMTFL